MALSGYRGFQIVHDFSGGNLFVGVISPPSPPFLAVVLKARISGVQNPRDKGGLAAPGFVTASSVSYLMPAHTMGRSRRETRSDWRILHFCPVSFSQLYAYVCGPPRKLRPIASLSASSAATIRPLGSCAWACSWLPLSLSRWSVFWVRQTILSHEPYPRISLQVNRAQIGVIGFVWAG